MKKKIDLTGQKIGKLLVLEMVAAPSIVKKKESYCRCLCDCGNYIICRAFNVKSKNTTSCGCNVFLPNNLIGQKFGKLLISEFAYSKGGNVYWRCLCDCGNIKIIMSKSLLSGNTKSCGCSKIKIHNSIQAINLTAIQIFKKRYADGDLSFEDFYNLSQQPCYYCGIVASNSNSYSRYTHIDGNSLIKQFGTFKYNGLDRVNNLIGHIKNNVIPCCAVCNRCKSDMTLEEFVTYINSLKESPNIIYANQLNKFIQRIKEIGSIDMKLLFPSGKSIYNNFNKSYIINNTMFVKLNTAKTNAKRRNLYFNLTQVQVFELLLNNCAYCNLSANPNNNYYNGIDRIDNNKGYEVNNCVSCCFTCNRAKGALSLIDFIEWIHKIKSNNSIYKIYNSYKTNI